MKIKYSSVLDSGSLMSVQSYIWLNSLLNLGICPSDIYVHKVGNISEEYSKYLKNLNINLIETKPFHAANKYCNKLVQLETFTNTQDYDYVFLMDCDTAIVSLDNLELTEDIYAKIVDFPNPPEEILRNIFSANNCSFNPVSPTFQHPNENSFTEWNNCNGGLYIISKAFLKEISRIWIEKALWCIENKKMFTPKFDKHADQVGFALAMSVLNKKVKLLDIKWNFPTHIKSNTIDIEPQIIHFHTEIDNQIKLIKTKKETVDISVEKINKPISKAIRTNFLNSLFWEFRYQHFKELGSGVGSRGDVLLEKRKILKDCFFNSEQLSVLDVGCGDLEIIQIFDFKDYLGLDLSPQVIEIAKQKRPDWNFQLITNSSFSVEPKDIVMCIDVLIHQPDFKSYTTLLNNLILHTNKRLIIGAYNSPPLKTSDITFYFEPIEESIKKSGAFAEIIKVGYYRDTTLIVADKISNNKTHPRDISPENIILAATKLNNNRIFRYLLDISRFYFGFFTSHPTRTTEYTWVAAKLENIVNKKRVIDLGAGLSPLPIFIAQKGGLVTTIDKHETNKTLSEKNKLNEWGYFDYNTLNKKIKSKNSAFEKTLFLNKFDFVFSVNVIELLPKQDRLKVIKKIARILKKGGTVLLTINLVPNTENIWNFAEGKEIESIETHGNVESLINEFRINNFEVVEKFFEKDIPESRTDVLFLELKKK